MSARELSDSELVRAALDRLEKMSITMLALQGILEQAGQHDLARLIWVEHLEARAAAEELGRVLEIEPIVE
jgi:hypothetical protein